MALWRVSATEVKNSWGRVVQRVLRQREPALVESKGVATVVILPADDYERLIAGQETEKRKQRQLALLDQAEQLAQATASRYQNQPLSDSTEIIRAMREERDGELLGLR